MNADADVQKALAGYQAAVNLTMHSSSEAWARFNAMVVANSIIMAGIGVVIAGDFAELRVALALGVAGLILCAAWLILVERGLEYAAYYVCSAREFELGPLAPVVRTLDRGNEFAQGRTVDIVVESRPKDKIGQPGRLLHGRWAARVVVAVFASLFAASLVFSVLLMAGVLSV